MIRSDALFRALLILIVAAVDSAAQSAGVPPSRRDQLAELSQRLASGDASAIDELLACTKPSSSPDAAPNEAEIERLRAEVEQLRKTQPATPPAKATNDARSTTPRDRESALREARAWLRAGDPIHSLKSLPSAQDAPRADAADDGEALYRKACALERLGRDEEALDAYRRAAAGAASPLSKLCASSGADHVEWRVRQKRMTEGTPSQITEVKP